MKARPRILFFVVLVASGLRGVAAMPSAEEVWQLIREVDALYEGMETGVDYDLPLRSPELEAELQSRAGGLPITPELHLRRKGRVSDFTVTLPALPDALRNTVEEKITQQLGEVESVRMLKDNGWTFILAFLRAIDAAGQFDVLTWSNEKAVLEFNDLSEPWSRTTMRSARFSIDRKRGTIDQITIWFGGTAELRISLTYAAAQFFPGTRVPIFKSVRIEQSGSSGPPAMTLIAGEGKYTRAQPAAAIDQARSWRVKLQHAGVERRLIDKSREDTDGKLHIDLSGSAYKDLRLLRGLPIKELNLSNTKVVDLEPLRGMPLVDVQLSGSPVSDLSPLHGMALEKLLLSILNDADGKPLRATQVTDLAPLRGMPLKVLSLDGTLVTDLTPLAECRQLEQIVFSHGFRDPSVKVVRTLPHLQRVAFGWPGSWTALPRAEDAWRQYDGQKN